MVTEEEALNDITEKDTEKILERMKASGVTFEEFTRAFDRLHPEHKPNMPIPSHFNESEWKAVIDQIRRSGESLSSAADDAAHQKKLTQDLEPRSGQRFLSAKAKEQVNHQELHLTLMRDVAPVDESEACSFPLKAKKNFSSGLSRIVTSKYCQQIGMK